MTNIELTQFYIDLGDRIKSARIKAELSQDILAQHLNLTRASIVNIEKGRQRPMIHTILEIARVLKVNVASLVLGMTTFNVNSESATEISFAPDFDNIITDDFTIDAPTKDVVKNFVAHIKK